MCQAAATAATACFSRILHNMQWHVVVDAMNYWHKIVTEMNVPWMLLLPLADTWIPSLSVANDHFATAGFTVAIGLDNSRRKCMITLH